MIACNRGMKLRRGLFPRAARLRNTPRRLSRAGSHSVTRQTEYCRMDRCVLAPVPREADPRVSFQMPTSRLRRV